MAEKGKQEDKAAQEGRATRYGIGVKAGGNVTRPGEFAGLGDAEFGDPVNYRYPIDAPHSKAAVSYFNQANQRADGGYTAAEWAIVGKRIAAAAEGKEFAGGKIVDKAQKAINLRTQQDELRRRFAEAFPGGGPCLIYDLYDEYAIVQYERPDAGFAPEGPVTPEPPTYWKVPYTATMKPVEGDPNGLQVLDTVTWTARPNWIRMLPTFVQFKAIDQADGRTRWLGISSGGFEDRDGELVSSALLEAAVQFADKAKLRGTLNFWHIPGSDIGTCDYQAVANGFLLESGLFDATPAGQHAARRLKEHAADYGMSIEFLWATKSAAGVYAAPGIILRRAVLPSQAAAFPWSALALKELNTMTIQVSDEKRLALAELVGVAEAERLLAGLDVGAEALKAAGVRFKELSEHEAREGDAKDAKHEAAKHEDANPALGLDAKELRTPDAGSLPPDAGALTPDAGAELQEFSMVLDEVTLKELSSRVTAVLRQAQEATLKEIMGGLETLRAATLKMSADVAELKRADALKVAEQVRDLPRATVKAIQRPTQRPLAAADSEQPSLEEIAQRSLYGS